MTTAVRYKEFRTKKMATFKIEGARNFEIQPRNTKKLQLFRSDNKKNIKQQVTFYLF